MTNKLNLDETAVIGALESLGEGEKIKGKELQRLTSLRERDLYLVINSLRRKGYAIGADKGAEYGGYFLISNEAELLNWHKSTLKGANKEIEVANQVLLRWYKKQVS